MSGNAEITLEEPVHRGRVIRIKYRGEVIEVDHQPSPMCVRVACGQHQGIGNPKRPKEYQHGFGIDYLRGGPPGALQDLLRLGCCAGAVESLLAQQCDLGRVQCHKHPAATVKDNRVRLGKSRSEFGDYPLNT